MPLSTRAILQCDRSTITLAVSQCKPIAVDAYPWTQDLQTLLQRRLEGTLQGQYFCLGGGGAAGVAKLGLRELPPAATLAQPMTGSLSPLLRHMQERVL
jgi:hypothetical protein